MAVVLIAALLAADPVPVKVTRDVTYATVDGVPLKLDLAAPVGGGPYPAVVLFHGGAWRYGHRSDLSRPRYGEDGQPAPSVIEGVAARGYVVASVSYRLAPKHPFPAQLDDARAAVRSLRRHAKTYNLDPERVAAGGFSAGGHIALLLALTDPPAEADPAAPSARVQAVVSYFGPTDLSRYAATPGLEDAYMVPWLGKGVKTDPGVYRRASPVEHVSADDPPVLLLHGTADVIVPVVHAERLLDKLRAARVTADLLKVPGEGHGWFGPAEAKTTRAAVEFLDKHLKGKR